MEIFSRADNIDFLRFTYVLYESCDLSDVTVE